jgi:uncharacterized protein YozE (UPF0346 family)
MKDVRQGRDAFIPLRRALAKPFPFTWTGNKAFNRSKGKRFALLCKMLDDKKFMAFCAAIGFVEIHWALFESQMDRWVEVSYNVIKFRWKGQEAPTTYARKSDWLTQAFTTNKRLTQFRTRGLDILSRAKTLSVTRHNLTHGTITGVEPVALFHYILENRRLNRTGQHSFNEFKFDARSFPKLSKDFERLVSDSIRLTSDLADMFL